MILFVYVHNKLHYTYPYFEIFQDWFLSFSFNDAYTIMYEIGFL